MLRRDDRVVVARPERADLQLHAPARYSDLRPVPLTGLKVVATVTARTRCMDAPLGKEPG
jgi:hypothetical protein